MRTPLMDRLCRPETLMAAWKKVRANKGGPGVDLVTIHRFEADLEANLAALSRALREERYYPMPVRRIQIGKSDGEMRDIGILTVEDRVVQRAVLDLLEPIFEAQFLDCSFGFRPGRSVEQAVEWVIAYKEQGYTWVVDADIADFFGSFDHRRLMGLISEQVHDRALLRLIQMWLDVGIHQGSSRSARQTLSRSTHRLFDALDAAAEQFVRRETTGGWGATGLEEGIGSPMDPKTELLRRLGRDGALLLLASSPRVRRRLFSPLGLALGGSALLTAAGLPVLIRAIVERSAKIGTVQGGPLSPLWANVYLHPFDRWMVKNGFALVRYADDFLILCPNEGRARHALKVATDYLADLKLTLKPEKTRMVPFEQGFHFLGYGFDKDGAYPLVETPGFDLSKELKTAVGQIAATGRQAVQRGKTVVSQLWRTNASQGGAP